MAPKDTNIPEIPISLITLEHMEISMTVIKTEWSITFHTHNIINDISFKFKFDILQYYFR